ncbi:MAG TPA: cytochrome c-type biogenesis CcmF C-terminal domain-containing protein, partial [Phenylobacterium sp.]|nr:cytochrome c-type biogenesis CcmF C-terminal domain-containing protein [Phenylobacterium sp.]
GPLLAWKRGDALGAAQRLWAAAALALGLGLAAYAAFEPRKAFAAGGVAVGAWLLLGALAELAERGRLGRAPAAETFRRWRGLPLGAWGMTLAHAGLGIFVLGAVVETAWKVETAAVLSPGQSLAVGAYELRLETVEAIEGPNFVAERARMSARRADRLVCRPTPERRLYPAGGQTTSEVALCLRGLDDLYIVLGEQRPGPDGRAAWLVRGYFNPWARLIFLGPAIMALGGLLSLADRRLRLAAPARRPSRNALAIPQ